MQHMTTVSEPVINFGQLLKIKREALGLSQQEAISKSKVTLLGRYEKNLSTPGKAALLKLIAFYRLSEDELQSCKKIENIGTPEVSKRNLIQSIYSLMEEALQEVSKMDDKGSLAKMLKKTAESNLSEARTLLEDLIIIDRLI